MDTVTLPFSKRIKELRSEKHWKQAELAQKANIDRNMISYYENGKYIPSADALVKLADAFDVSVDYFLFEEIQKKPLRQTLDQETVNIVSQINQLTDVEKDSVLNILKSLVMKNKVKDLVSMVS